MTDGAGDLRRVRARPPARPPGHVVAALLTALALLGGACSGGDDPAGPDVADQPGTTSDAAPDDAPDDSAADDAPLDVDQPPVDGDGQDAETAPAKDDGPVADDSAPGDTSDAIPPPVPEGRDRLVGRIQNLVDAAVEAAPDADLGVLVTDVHGRQIAGHQADVPLLPASTLKVVTAAAILTTLGPTGRLSTRVEATAPIDGDGVLRGDVLLIGGGDPALATDEYSRWIYPARPATPLAALADELVASGLRRVAGDVVGSAPGFTGPTRAEGWPDRYFSSFDARYASGLTVDGGLRTILTYPEPEEDPDDEGSTGDDPAPAADDARVDDDPDAAAEDDADDIEDLGPPTVTVDHVTDPAAHAAAELVRLLEERDVEVVGEARSGDDTAPPVGRLARVQSPPMDELLRFTVERSDNHLADGMFQTIGRIRTGEGSWARGDRALRQVLDRFEIDHEGAVFADGSGLSRNDRVSPRLLVDLDRHMSDGPTAETWVSLMAVMGETGTLRERLVGTVAAGRFRGKTGTLRDVMALSGAVVGDDGDRYHLAVLANEATGPGRWIARQLMDELALQLSAEVAGCEVAVAQSDDPDDDEPPSLPRAVITC